MEPIDIKIVEESAKPLAMNAKKFGLWLFLGSVFMLFMSLTSAYIVRQADGNWTVFDLPSLFWLTTVVILLSSVTMQWAYFAAKKDNQSTTQLMVTLTLILGVVFLVGQFYGWKQLVFDKVYLVGNPSGSFVYVLTGLHGLHIISALVAVAILLVSVSRRKVNPRSMLGIEMCATYWHFLGVLWLYLFVFLIYFR
jgi:cytochrome c oxidase subunit 3